MTLAVPFLGLSKLMSIFFCAGVCVFFLCVFEIPLPSGPILESEGMRAIFQKKDKKMFKKGKIFEHLGKNVQNMKIF